MLRLPASAFVALAMCALSASANAQDARCVRLISQLDAVNRSGGGNSAQALQYRDAIERQRAEIDRSVAYSRSIGCERKPGISPQCLALDSNIRRMQRSMASLQAEYQRVAADSGQRQAGERERILAALQDLRCNGYAAGTGQPIRRRPPGFFEQLFGADEGEPDYEPAPPRGVDPNGQTEFGTDGGMGGGMRTICVRKCDGFYFPISFSTTSDYFQTDAETCQRLCPASEVELYAYDTMSQQPDDAVSAMTSEPLKAMPNAFKFRTQFDQSCSCRAPGQSWAEALGPAEEVLKQIYGDKAVTKAQSDSMAQPKPVKPKKPKPAPSQTTPGGMQPLPGAGQLPRPPAPRSPSGDPFLPPPGFQ